MSSAYFSGTSGDRFLDVVELYSGASRLSKSLQEAQGFDVEVVLCSRFHDSFLCSRFHDSFVRRSARLSYHVMLKPD